MGIGRNELCLCKSGKKYKKCCALNENEYVKYLDPRIPDGEVMVRQFDKDKVVTTCLHPNNHDCTKLQGAHAISEKRVLKKISDQNGKILKLYLGYNEQQNLSVKIREIGTGKASVFYGFCNKHDSIFQPIDNLDYNPVDETQNFLFSYRAFCFEYHQLNESIKANQKLFKESKKVHEDVSKILSMLNRQKNRLDEYLNKYNEYILSTDYSNIIYRCFIFQGQSQIAVASAISPFYDIENNEITSEIKNSKSIGLNIFPQDTCTYVVFSWFKDDNDSFIKLITQFENLSIENQINYLNNMVPLYARRSLFLSPLLWSRLSIEERNALKATYHPSFVHLISHKNLLNKPKYNIFRTISH
ncbi:YecA family protein [Paenibacillus sp. FSL H8-0283]|uniref:YecA family protein n=1 Tax=Paenibacillus sp. FSL H8-0283 TaxID=2921383 RepID=UPI0032434671